VIALQIKLPPAVPGRGAISDERGPWSTILGARLRTHNQNMTVAARAIAERKTVGDLS
jgi:hypothetical protein